MADKGKRLRKILDKKGMKGQLKPVGSLEEAHLILIVDKQHVTQYAFVGKDEYKRMVENGHTFTEDMIYFLVSANPRNRWHIERRLLTNKVGSIKSGYK